MQNVEMSTNATTPMKKLEILVDRLRISGFRGIKNLEISFTPMTVLIGQNNSGKTTVLSDFSMTMGNSFAGVI